MRIGNQKLISTDLAYLSCETRGIFASASYIRRSLRHQNIEIYKPGILINLASGKVSSTNTLVVPNKMENQVEEKDMASASCLQPVHVARDTKY